MKQHNYWKLLKLHQTSVKYILWALGGVIIVYSYFWKNVNFEVVSKIIGYVTIGIGFILSQIEKRLWKMKFMGSPLLENYWTPVIEGRWTGTLTRNGLPDNGKPHDFVIEITQSYTSVMCVTYSKHSHSASIAAEILFDEDRKLYKLIYYWQGKTTNAQPNTGDTNTFDGFTMLDIIVNNGNVTRLSGSYFTDRQPHQTKGTISVEFEQKTLKNSFE